MNFTVVGRWTLPSLFHYLIHINTHYTHFIYYKISKFSLPFICSIISLCSRIFSSLMLSTKRVKTSHHTVWRATAVMSCAACEVGQIPQPSTRDSRKCFIKPFYINYVIHIRGHIHISYDTLKVMKTSLFE